MSATIKRVNKDWADREFVEEIQLSVLRMAEFLNKFDNTMHFRLSQLNDKLVSLERNLEFLDNAVKFSKAGGNSVQA
jgi:hypothetical protein